MLILPIKTSWLRAALVIAAKKDVRYYLNTVCVETSPRYFYVVATDGKRLVAFSQPFEGLESNSYLIERADAETASKSREEYVSLIVDGDSVALDGKPVRLCADRYVQWRSVVPSETSGEVAQLDSGYMADFHKIGRIIDDRSKNTLNYGGFRTFFNGDSPSLVLWYGCPQAIGVVMSIIGATIPERPAGL